MSPSVTALAVWPILAANARLQAVRARTFYKHLSVSELFAEIYRSRAWGSRQDARFCSGDGSMREDVVGPYCHQVEAFIRANDIRTIVDLGCGDFTVGSRLLDPLRDYTAIDIVPELLEENRRRYAGMPVTFLYRDIVSGELPEADLCLVRQVLQHLSNAEILHIVPKLLKYRYAIVTEHVYVGRGLRPNVDKPHGPGTRIPRRSGVFLECPPFRSNTTTLFEIPITKDEVLRACLIDAPVASGGAQRRL
jgi:SAM-dependent methyltransferase